MGEHVETSGAKPRHNKLEESEILECSAAQAHCTKSRKIAELGADHLYSKSDRPVESSGNFGGTVRPRTLFGDFTDHRSRVDRPRGRGPVNEDGIEIRAFGFRRCLQKHGRFSFITAFAANSVQRRDRVEEPAAA